MSKTKWKTALNVLFVAVLAFSLIALALLTVFSTNQVGQAEEPFTPDIIVKSAKELKQAVLDAPTDATNYKIRISDDITLGTAEDNIGGEQWGLRVAGGRNITLDLNGHKITRSDHSWVILVNVNSKLTLIDTSAKKTGTITNDNYIWTGQPLLYNYGGLDTSVNFTVPDYTTSDGVTHDIAKGDNVSGDNNVAIYSESDSVNFAKKNWNKPTVTINGGTLSGPANGSIIRLTDSNLTVNGGTFVPNHLTETPPGYSIDCSPKNKSIIDIDTLVINAPSGISDFEAAKAAAQDDLHAFESYRGSSVVVNDGDFTAFTSEYGSKYGLFNIDRDIKIGYTQYPSMPNYFSSESTGETIDSISVLIENGKWGKDLSAYTPDNKWMELFDPTIDEGSSAKKYYIVKEASEDAAGAIVTVGESTRYYIDFASAWGAIGTTTEDRTLKLCKDAKVEQLDFSKMSGNITFDLNGRKLTIECNSSMTSGHIDFGSQRDMLQEKDISLIVKDGKESGGELILDTPSGGSISTNSFIHIQGYAKFTLESGTIRQTGYFPADYKETTKVDDKADEAIFHLGSGVDVEAQDVVTIKGGNIISEIYYGTEDAPGELSSSPYLVSWYVGTFEYELNFEEGTKYTDKTKIFKFDLNDYILTDSKTSVFSWNFKDSSEDAQKQWGALESTFQAFTLSSYGKDYMLSNFTESDKFLASDGNRYGTLKDAVSAKNGDNFSITVLQDNLTIEESIELDGITLDFDRNKNFTLTLSEGTTLTLRGGATLRNGTLKGDVTVDGDATMQNMTVTGNVAVNSGTLTIPSGTYQGTFTFESGADAIISGGTFMGSQIKTLDQYFVTTYGAWITAGEEYADGSTYDVKIAPNLKAQEWYNKYKNTDEFEIATTDEWNYFAIYVSSGASDFKGKTVKLTENLNFGYVPSVNGVSVVSEPLTFYPAGNQTYKFNGTFDGQGNKISGVYVVEINAGVFGGTGSAMINNLTVADSLFIGGKGVGYFDEFNTEKGWVFVGGVVAQGNLGHTDEGKAATGIKVQNVTLSQKEPGNIMGGGFIGQTWSTLYFKGIEVDGVTLDGGWKMGGVVGFTEASVIIIDGDVKNVESVRDCIYFGSVMGQLVGNSLTLDGCNVQAPDSYLVGGMDAGSATKDVNIKGVGTDIATKGTTGTTGTSHGSHDVDLNITVPTTSEETEESGGFNLDFKEEEIPNDSYVFTGDQVVVLDEDGNEVTKVADELSAADEGKVIAGEFEEAIDEKYIAPGYAYIKDESSSKYVICEITKYYPTLLSGTSEDGSEKSLAEYKDYLVNTYEYSQEAIEKINAIYTRIEKELEESASELTMTDVRKLINSAKVEMDAVPVLSAEEEQKAAELEQAKKDAKIELQLYAASKGVSLTDKSVTDGLEAIEKATSESEVTSALTSAQSKVDSVKAAQDRAEQEQGQKTEAAQALKEAKQQAANDLKLYALSQGVSLTDKSVTDGLKEIEDATNEQLLSLAVTSAQSKIDEVKQAQDKAQAEKDKQEQQAQAAQALKESKQQAANDLKLYATSNGVSLTDKSVTDGLEAIEKAASESEVTSALTSAQSKVDEVKQAQDKAKAEKDKQEQQAQAEKEQQAQSAQALKESKQQAANDLKLYATSNGVSLTDKSVTDGLEAIKKATSESEVTSALTSAQSKVDGAKVEPEPTNSVNGFEIALLCICIAEVIAVAVIVTVMLVKRKKNK